MQRVIKDRLALLLDVDALELDNTEMCGTVLQRSVASEATAGAAAAATSSPVGARAGVEG